MYCGNCLRDNALVTELRRMGHSTLMLPLYLPLTLDETDQSAGTPVFFGGVSVYLDQKWPWFRRAPAWLRRPLASPRVLRWAAGRAARTRAAEVGDLTVSMLRGEEGNQQRDLDRLVAWLATQPHPDAVLLSNALLIGMARRLKRDLGARVICMLQGEDDFLDAMSEPCRSQAWRTLAERAAEVDRLVAPSQYFADRMGQRLGLGRDKIAVVPNGIQLEGYLMPGADDDRIVGSPARPPVVGYLARMSRDKGLDLLVEAFVELRRRDRAGRVRLRVAGSCTAADELFVRKLEGRLAAAGLAGEAEFRRNLDRAAKLEFLRSLTVFSVPAVYSEAFGLYLLEALAAGVPVVQPRAAAFPELLEATGGGVLCEPGNAPSLADALETLLLDPARRQALGRAGQASVWRDYSARRMAERMLEVCAAER